MRWIEFAERCPELAALGQERLAASQLCLVGTLRANGFPRISPCEPDFAAGQLLLGMMWRSPKALDLLRDPRCVVHSTVAERAGTEGDFKLYGRAAEVRDAELWSAYRHAVKARLDWEPPRRYHVFAVGVESAGFVVFGDDPHSLAWDPARGLRKRRQRLA
jgi:hypothetical protein